VVVLVAAEAAAVDTAAGMAEEEVVVAVADMEVGAAEAVEAAEVIAVTAEDTAADEIGN
jgi:hypothetical protein